MVDNVTNLESARGRGHARPPGEDNRTLIRIRKGELNRHVDEAEAALVKAKDNLYRYGGRIVHIEWDFIRVSGGGTTNALRLFEATANNIKERLEKVCRFEKWDARSMGWVGCGCPDDIAPTFIDRGSWKLPALLGVVTAPTLRQDGSVIDQSGYDERTGIVFEPHGLKFPQIPEKPTRQQAIDALQGLNHVLRKFDFVTEADRAVALSAILTAVVRRALPVAPMHAFSSPMPGAGKSMLVDIASVIATGWRAAVTAWSNDQYGSSELDKRITASLLMGDAIISIDNIDRPLSGGFLCQCLTQYMLNLRILGLSKTVVTPNTATFFATGNNLTVMNDATRRVLRGTVNPNVERPELREFNFKPVALALRARAALVVKVLTIIRAFLTSGEKVKCSSLGSYEDWSRFVRHPLMWLGCVDPASSIDEVRADDPNLGRTRAVVEAWERVMGLKPTHVRSVIRAATLRLADAREEVGLDAYENPDLLEALRGVADGGGRDAVNPDKLGHWLRKHVNMVVSIGAFAGFTEQRRFVQLSGSGREGATWQLEIVG